MGGFARARPMPPPVNDPFGESYADWMNARDIIDGILRQQMRVDPSQMARYSELVDEAAALRVRTEAAAQEMRIATNKHRKLADLLDQKQRAMRAFEQMHGMSPPVS